MRKIALALIPIMIACSQAPAKEPQLEIDANRRYSEGKIFRNYNKEPTGEEIDAMRFILKNLSKKSLAWLWSHEKDLEEFGNQIDHIHPLKFLETILTIDEFIVYVKNIKNREGFVWSEFIGGFEKSFEEERRAGNLHEDHFFQFVSVVQIDPDLVYKKFSKGDWEGFMKTLIMNVKRSGEPDRYDQ